MIFVILCANTGYCNYL